jgi:hypothetical protein
MQIEGMSGAHRAFWILVAAVELTLLACAMAAQGFAFGPLLLALSQAPVVLLALQRRLWRHNFWAGYLGVFVLFAPAWILSMAGLLRLLGGAAGLPLLLSATVLYLLTLLALAMYVFASPRLWFARAA